jgi:rubredoxin
MNLEQARMNGSAPCAKERDLMASPNEMYQCQTTSCGYIYDPDKGDRKGKIPKGTAFNDLPEDWKCPICGAGKHMFKPLAGPGSAMAEKI